MKPIPVCLRRFAGGALVANLICAQAQTARASDLAWRRESFGRSAPLAVAPSAKAGFVQLDPNRTGIRFENRLSPQRYTTNQIYLNGSGVALGDVDGDGRVDVFFAALDGRNALYRNLGDWKFEEITGAAGVACPGRACSGAVFADVDGDGDLDLLVNTIGGGTLCFLNDGHGRFQDATQAMGLGQPSGASSMALGDADGDGYLDLYVANYRTTTLRDQPGTRFHIQIVDGRPVVATVNGRPTTDPDLVGRFTLDARGRIAEHGEADFFYHNVGGRRFARVPFDSGKFLDEEGRPIATPYDWGLSVMMRDLNGDGLPDIYVCNDFDSPDRIWINRGGGVFQALSSRALRSTSRFSMGMDVADINRDGQDDLFNLDMREPNHVRRMTRADRQVDYSHGRPQLPRNTLQLNRGDGTYVEIGNYAGVTATSWSWSPMFLDVDLDGYEDLLITAGHARDDMDIDYGMQIQRMKQTQPMSAEQQLELRMRTPPLLGTNVAFRNLGNLKFAEMGRAWGFDAVGVSHGAALADLDNDGALDVVINRLNAPALVYRNQSGAARVAVRLKGAGGNTRGIGARITLRGGAVPEQSQEMICGGRYLSGDDAERVFAAGKTKSGMELEVRWRSGRVSLIKGVEANRLYEVWESAAAAGAPKKKETTPDKELFEDASAALIGYQDSDVWWPEEFERQPSLTRGLSGLDGGAAWEDLDGDGKEELIIASGTKLWVYKNIGAGKFRLEKSGWGAGEELERGGVAALPGEILTGLWNYRAGGPGGMAEYSQSGRSGGIVGEGPACVGPIALADMDGDGQLEMFLGGRVIPGKYPMGGGGRIFRRSGGRWVEDPINSQVLSGVGMVSAALWSDLDGDGYPELVLACDEGPVRVFANDKGHLREATREWGLENYRGLWTGIAAGDFNGDGKMDLIVGNWGRNSGYEVSGGRGFKVYCREDPSGGGAEQLETYWDSAMAKEVPMIGLQRLVAGMPWVAGKFSSYRQYGEAGVDELLGDEKSKMAASEVNWLGSSLFINRGGKFEVSELPPPAQWSAVYGIAAADLDGDGNEDVVLVGNMFGTRADEGPQQGLRGLWLKGNGRGGFAPQGALQSGLRADGEGRGLALGDYDGDGRVDLAIVQRGAGIKLYHNRRAKRGLRVKLQGPPGNRDGVGVIMRLQGRGWQGPAREVHKGSGYWSCDSPAQVLGFDRVPEEIWTRWPGGKVVVAKIPAGAQAITLDEQGRCTVAINK